MSSPFTLVVLTRTTGGRSPFFNRKELRRGSRACSAAGRAPKDALYAVPSSDMSLSCYRPDYMGKMNRSSSSCYK